MAFRCDAIANRPWRAALRACLKTKSNHMRLAQSLTEIPPRCALPPFCKGGTGGIYSRSVMKCTNVLWSDLATQAGHAATEGAAPLTSDGDKAPLLAELVRRTVLKAAGQLLPAEEVMAL